MAEVRIQTGWCRELSAEMKDCVRTLQQAEEIASSIHISPAVSKGVRLENRRRALAEDIGSTVRRLSRMDAFLNESIEIYEELERTLLRQLEELKSPSPAAPSGAAKLFKTAKTSE